MHRLAISSTCSSSGPLHDRHLCFSRAFCHAASTVWNSLPLNNLNDDFNTACYQILKKSKDTFLSLRDWFFRACDSFLIWHTARHRQLRWYDMIWYKSNNTIQYATRGKYQSCTKCTDKRLKYHKRFYNLFIDAWCIISPLEPFFCEPFPVLRTILHRLLCFSQSLTCTISARPTMLHRAQHIYRVFTRSSKRPALARVFWIHLLEVCWTFAGSCKHPINGIMRRYIAI